MASWEDLIPKSTGSQPGPVFLSNEQLTKLAQLRPDVAHQIVELQTYYEEYGDEAHMEGYPGVDFMKVVKQKLEIDQVKKTRLILDKEVERQLGVPASLLSNTPKLMKLIKPIRTALLERILEATSRVVPKKPETSGPDDFGMTKAQRSALVNISTSSSVSDARIVAKFHCATHTPHKTFAEVEKYVDKLINELPNQAVLHAPLFAAITFPGDDAHQGLTKGMWTVIMVHELKGLYLHPMGGVDHSILFSTKWSPATNDEIEHMLDHMTEQQIQTIMSHNYFRELIMSAVARAADEEDDDDDDDGDSSFPQVAPPVVTIQA